MFGGATVPNLPAAYRVLPVTEHRVTADRAGCLIISHPLYDNQSPIFSINFSTAFSGWLPSTSSRWDSSRKNLTA